MFKQHPENNFSYWVLNFYWDNTRLYDGRSLIIKFNPVNAMKLMNWSKLSVCTLRWMNPIYCWFYNEYKGIRDAVSRSGPMEPVVQDHQSFSDPMGARVIPLYRSGTTVVKHHETQP